CAMGGRGSLKTANAVSLPPGTSDWYANAPHGWPAHAGVDDRRRGQFVMARIPYFEENDHPELGALIDKIKAGRRGGLLNVYKLLLHAPPLAETWLDHVGAVRWKTAISGRLRELLVIRIAYVNGIAYVINQHVPGLALADGVTL